MLAPGVVADPGATVVDSVRLPGVRVRSGASVTRAALDDGVVVGAGATVDGDGEIALVGRTPQPVGGACVPAWARFPDPEQARRVS